jgi:signal transduction histidine kinase
MIETHPDEFWVGSPGGLLKAVLKDNQFEFNHFEEAGHAQNGLRNDHVAALLKDRNDASILWIGTKGGGLQKLDTRTMTFTNFNTQHGLPNDVIYGILDDDHGNLWLSSNKGITRFNPKSGQITNFVEADGLQSDEFNTFAYTKTPNGQMVFGGILGMNVFHPDDLLQNQSTGTPYLSDLFVNNTQISPGDSTGILDVALEYTGSITLPYSQNNITLHFVSTEYAAPFKNRFRHYLEGAEEAWTHESTDDHTSYLNLSPGRYTFHLMSSNNDGVWSPATAMLDIRITPPWYRSGLAYVLYILLTGLIIWRLLQMREGRIKMQHEVQIKQNEAARLVELDAVKSRLYTNITHEFRTPLTVISGIAEEMDAAQEHKDLIKRNSDQLLELVNQMLELRKLESNAMPIVYEQLDSIAFLGYIVEAYTSFAQSKGLTLTFTSGTQSVMMDVDRQKLTRVMSNLLSNAIKFTPSGDDPVENEVVVIGSPC